MKIPDFNTLAEFAGGDSASNKKGRARRGSKPSAKSKEKALIEYIVENAVKENIDLTDRYENYFNVGMALVNSFGEEGREYFHALCRMYPEYNRDEVDEKYTNLLQTSNGEITAKTLIKIAKDHGISVFKEDKTVANQVIDYLSENYKFRENVRTSRLEYTMTADEADQEWMLVNDKVFDTIFTQVLQYGIRISTNNLAAIIRSEMVAHAYDPVECYFQGIAPYDDSMRGAIDDIVDHFVFDDNEDVELARLKIRKWFINMVARWRYNDTETQSVLVLVGQQFVGKTYILQKILPPVLSQYCDVVLPNEDFRDKDRKLTLSEKLLLVLDEWTIGKKVSNVIKAVTSLGQTSLRDSYHHFRENRQCIAAFCMTSNEDTPLSMREGRRRYLSIRIKGTVNLKQHPMPYDKAYAEAVHIIESGEDYHFTTDEIRRISEHNEQFTEIMTCEAAICKFYRVPKQTEKGIAIGTADIIEKIRFSVPPSDLTPANIGKAMKQLGFKRYMSGGVAKYYVYEFSGEEINQDRVSGGDEIYNMLRAENGTSDDEVSDGETPSADADAVNADEEGVLPF